MRAIRAAMRQERYWRAAAWVLKRRNPDNFGPRQPKVFSQAELCQVLSKVAEMLVGELPEENCRRTIQWLDEVILGLRDEIAATSDAPAAMAQPPDNRGLSQFSSDENGTVPFGPESDAGGPLAASHSPSTADDGGLKADAGELSQFSSDETGTLPFTADNAQPKAEAGGPLAASHSPSTADERGPSQFSSDENGTVPFGADAAPADEPLPLDFPLRNFQPETCPSRTRTPKDVQSCAHYANRKSQLVTDLLPRRTTQLSNAPPRRSNKDDGLGIGD